VSSIRYVAKTLENDMFEDVYLVDTQLSLINPTAILDAENKLSVTLPRGYHSFLTTLGHGTFCDQVYVFLPSEIEEKTMELRKTLRDYFFWDRGINVLGKSQIEQSLLIARSLDGDELIYHPDSEHGVYVLPRHDDNIYWLSPDFDDPVEWHADSGSPMPEPPFRYFEPAQARTWIELFTTRTDHQMADVATAINESLISDSEMRSIIEDSYQLHFHQAVGSRVQLSTSYGDDRIRIRIDYNPKHEKAIAACIVQLESDGFYQTGRHAT
jgi:hypothetical protein